MPVGNDWASDDREFLSPEHELLSYFLGPKYEGTGATNGLDEDDADFIDQTMKQVEHQFDIKVDRSRMSESVEAWVWVTIASQLSSTSMLRIASGLGPEPWHGVLTWTNSD